MAKYGSNSVVIKLDSTDGGSLVDISQYVLGINGVSIEKLVEESHTFGDAWFEALQTGLSKMDDVELDLFYDDTASTGPDAILNIGTITHAATRTLEITYGSTKKSTVETWITKYQRLPKRGELTKAKATLKPTGSVTEA